MKKYYRIIVLLIILMFTTTYNPNQLNISHKKNYNLFKIEKIEIIKNILVKNSEIQEKLFEIKGKNIFFIKRKDIEKPLKFISFLEKVEVKKKYPNTIIIKVYETKPIGVLFKKNEKFIIDSISNLYVIKESNLINDLPHIFGEDAEIDFVRFYNLLKENNFPRKKVKNLYYFRIGRWDIELINGQIIKFPKNKIVQSIKQSIELLNRKDFEKYNTIDLRINDKIIVE